MTIVWDELRHNVIIDLFIVHSFAHSFIHSLFESEIQEDSQPLAVMLPSKAAQPLFGPVNSSH